MLRRRRLHLVGALLALAGLLVVGCDPGARLHDTDAEPVGHAALRAARAPLVEGRGAEAVTAFQRLVDANPTSWAAARGLQDAVRSMTTPADFEAIYRRGVADEPSALSWYLLGRALIDRPDEARAAFQKARDLAPKQPWPIAGLAYLRWVEGDLFLTVQTYEDGLQDAPASAKLRYLLGRQLLDLKLLIGAQRQLELARRLDPDDPEIRASLGKLYALLGRYDAAEALLEEVLAEDPDIADVYPTLSSLALRRRDLDRAERLYRRGLDLGLGADEELAAGIRAARIVEQAASDEAEPPP